MKNKASLFNIVLALIIVVLVFQLSKPTKEEHHHKKNHKPHNTQVNHTPINESTNDNNPNTEKVSVGTKAYIMPKPALVIGSYDKNNHPNIMTAAWAGIASSSPVSIAVSISSSHKTYENIKETGYFTVNVPSVKYVAQMDYAGTVSGRDEDKFQKLNLTPVKGSYANAPYVKEFPIVMECQVIDSVWLGTQVQFIGKILDTKVDGNILDKNNHVDISKLQPIIYEHDFYYSYGAPIAKPFDIYKLLKDDMEPSFYTGSTINPTLNTIFNRKSVRHFTDEKVSEQQLSLLCRAAMAAPTAVNKQPWAFVAIDNRAILDSLAEVLPYAKMLKKATAAVVVCGDLTRAAEGYKQAYWIQDCSAATENLLLAAESMGLGAVWTGVHPNNEREDLVRNTLNIPTNQIPLNVIAIGYPTGEDQPKDKWDESKIHWNNW